MDYLFLHHPVCRVQPYSVAVRWPLTRRRTASKGGQVDKHPVCVIVIGDTLRAMVRVVRVDAQVRHEFDGASASVNSGVEPVDALLRNQEHTPPRPVENHGGDAIFMGIVM